MNFKNYKQYEWQSMTIVIGGRTVAGVRGVSYTESQEKEVVYGKGSLPLAVQRGNKSYSGSVTLLQSEVEALQAASPKTGSVLDLDFDIVVVYGNPSQGDAIKTDFLHGCQFTECPKAMSQGDKFMEIELPFVFLGIESR